MLGKGLCVREDTELVGRMWARPEMMSPSLVAPSAPGLLFKFLFYSK